MLLDALSISEIGLFITLMGIVGTGAWVASAQSAAIATLDKRINEIETTFGERRTRDGVAADRQSADMSLVQQRLTRIETQLEYLVDAQRGAKHEKP